uniref:Uncharacterized protein n=1 Tax=Anopheles culicifacies TaxID=139723 RepID=A0A182MPC1_9DIPT
MEGGEVMMVMGGMQQKPASARWRTGGRGGMMRAGRGRTHRPISGAAVGQFLLNLVDDTDDPPDEGGVLGNSGGDVFKLSCCRWGGIWSEGVEDDDDDSEDEEEDDEEDEEEDEEEGVGGASVGVDGVGGSSIAVGLFPSPVPLVVLDEELLLRLESTLRHRGLDSDWLIDSRSSSSSPGDLLLSSSMLPQLPIASSDPSPRSRPPSRSLLPSPRSPPPVSL